MHSSIQEIQASGFVSTDWQDWHSARHCVVNLVACGLDSQSQRPTQAAETANQVYTGYV